MTELNRKVEPCDILVAIAGITARFPALQDCREMDPPELVALKQLADGLLAIRSVLEVQDDIQKNGAEALSAELLKVATSVSHRANKELLRQRGFPITVDALLDDYKKAVKLMEQLAVAVDDDALALNVRTVLGWTY